MSDVNKDSEMSGEFGIESTKGLTPRVAVDGTVIEWLRPTPEAIARNLTPHPEGGWYRRTWASPTELSTATGARPAATLIEFLLPPGEQSAWHLVTNDEIWLWHGPDALNLELGGDGSVPSSTPESFVLGPDVDAGQHVQVVVPGGVWQRTLPSNGTCLVSCMVSPGFSFDDFSLEDEQTESK